MANIVPYAFPVELLKGNHDFAADTYTMSLYTNNGGAVGAYTVNSTVALLGPAAGGAPNYEVSTQGTTRYTAQNLTGQSVANINNVATVDFTDPIWGNTVAGTSTFTARGAAIYNLSDTNKLVVILDFGADFSCSNGTFTVTFPAANAGTPNGSDALLSITS
jgi:hypothetical protein|tara:strand:+ start:724 stop:1209 length:486 start_codon:yes stop_codon:yes gene_type:complete